MAIKFDNSKSSLKLNALVGLGALTLIAILVTVSGCTITSEGIEKKAIEVGDIFPPSKSVASYKMVDKPLRMTDKDLSEQLGDKTHLELFKKWGGLGANFCDYGLPQHPPKVRVSITELPSKLIAYGLYTNLRPSLLPERQYVKIGVHGTIDGPRLTFVQDRYLIVVKDLSNSPEEQRRSILVAFGTNMSNRIPRDISDVEPVAFLPIQYRVTASERLDKEDPLGLNIFTQGGATAVYRKEDREAKIFLALTTTTWGKSGEFEKLKKVVEKNGPTKSTLIGDKGFAGTMFNQTFYCSMRDTVIFGTFGNFSAEEQQELMAAIDRKVKPLIVTPYSELKKKDQEAKEKEEAEAEEERKRR